MKQLFAVIAAWTLAVAVCAAEAPAVRYVVTLQVPPIEASATANDLVTRYGGKVVPLSAQNFVGVAVETTPDAAARMADDPRVASIEAQFIGGNAAHVAGPVMLETAGIGVKGVAIPRPLQTPPRAAAASPKIAPPHASSSQAPLRAIANGTGDWNSGTYSYDGAGNIYAIGSNYYVYDKASRLTEGTPAYESSVTSTRHQTFSYDMYGNLATLHTTDTQSVDETMLAAEAATNRLSMVCKDAIGNDIPCYDAAGNVLILGSNTYTWDAFNVMTGKTGEQYLYDADDERIARITSTATTYTLRGPDQKELRELTYSGSKWTWNRDYIYRDDLLLAQVLPRLDGSGEITRHFHLDHLGTPRIATNELGSRTATMVYWPYGVEAPGTDLGDARDPLRFTGHERDKDASSGAYDLNYMHARYQLARKGRFLSVDPELGDPSLPQSWNRYTYVRNNPVNRSDPTGMVDWSAVPDYLYGVGSAFATDLVMGMNRPAPSSSAMAAGQFAGDLVALDAGGAEIGAGGGVAAAGGTVTVLSLGSTAAVTVPAAGAGIAVAGHGITVVATAAAHLIQAGAQMSASPTLPDKTIASGNGVTVEHNYKSGDHPPAHAHVTGGGPETRIGPNGKPLKGNPELTRAQRAVVQENKSVIRKAINKIGRWLDFNGF